MFNLSNCYFFLVDHYERTLTVDGEETTLVVMDTWEPDKLVIYLYIYISRIYSKIR